MNEYEIGINLKKTNPKLALNYFMSIYEPDNIDVRYQIGRIYALSKDRRCIQLLNDLALYGYKKSAYYLSEYFRRANYPKRDAISRYFLRISDSVYDFNGLLQKYNRIKEICLKNDTKDISKEFIDFNVMELFKLCQIYPDLYYVLSIYCLKAYNDDELARIYYKKYEESQKVDSNQLFDDEKYFEEEDTRSLDLLKHRANEGDINAQLYVTSKVIFDESDEFKSYIDLNKVKITYTGFYSEFKKGMEAIINLDYETGMILINISAEQNNLLAVYFKALFTFHGHCYEKEREKSLEIMIECGEMLGGRYAFEVGVILLQGVFINQDIAKGIEMIKISELTGYEIPQSIKYVCYYVEFPSFYEDIIQKEYSSYYENSTLTKEKEKIMKNPIYLAKEGFSRFNKGNFNSAAKYLRAAIEQDYIDAEFVYALVWRNESCHYLLRGARGGNIESQILLGLYCLYGINHEANKEEGIFWLEVAAYQEDPTAYLILSSFYHFGFRNVTRDTVKSRNYLLKFKNYKMETSFEIIPFLKNELEKIIEKYQENFLSFINN